LASSEKIAGEGVPIDCLSGLQRLEWGMRNFWRLTGKRIWAGSVIVVSVLLLTVAPVDRTPIEGASYATQTRGRIEEFGRQHANPKVGRLRAGFGRASLTPTTGVAVDEPEQGRFRALPLAGYGSRAGRPATGVMDDLWVKAVACEVGGRTGVIVALDALIVPREVADLAWPRIERELGLEQGQVYMGATHTHCGPGGWGQGVVAEIFAGDYVAGVREWICGQMLQAIQAALADLKPASVGTGGFDAPSFTRNRLVGESGRLDSRFSLLEFRQEGGGRAVVGAYSAHATVHSGRVMEFSGDYPGVWQREMESTGTQLAVFLAGAVGSHAPKPPESGAKGALSMGRALAVASNQALEKISLTNHVSWDVGCLEVDLPRLQWRITDRLRTREWFGRRLFPIRESTWLHFLRIADAVWLGTPCDYSGELALDLVDATKDSGVAPVVTSFNGDYVGYVVPSKYYGMNTYETRTMSFFGPQLPDYFDGLLRELVTVISGANGAMPP